MTEINPKNVGAFLVDFDSCQCKNLKIASHMSHSVGRVDNMGCVFDVDARFNKTTHAMIRILNCKADKENPKGIFLRKDTGRLGR